ncbi:hypothetical protein [Desulfobacter postgatei]|uniref:hypothetical protein n=1 Tax=Desulfobacter postgatei TaxID=2293 RepID=UPI00259AF150|nr:hypothetical protein [uncultured Desulfobacter sp.]
MLNTTLIKPRRYRSDTIIGHNVRDIIDPLDQPAIFDTLKKVVLENTHAFVAYSMQRTLSFITLLVPFGGDILCFELASSPLSNKEYQKQLLLNSARGLIPELQHQSGSDFTTV